MRPISDVDGLTAADVMHRRLTSTPATATVGELREYFGFSTSRRLALVVDGERFLGALTPEDLAADADAGAAVAAYVRAVPSAAPADAAADARDTALATPSRRLPVVDATGALVGVVAINKDCDGFCGT